MVARAVELDIEALALTDHQGLYGAVRFCAAAEAVGVRPILGVEIELLDSAVPDPGRLVVPARRAHRRTRQSGDGVSGMPRAPLAVDGTPVPMRIDRPGHPVIENHDARTCGGSATANAARTWCCCARDMTGWESLCRMVSAAHLDGTKGVPRFTHELLARHAEGLALLTGCRHGEVARRFLAGDRPVPVPHCAGTRSTSRMCPAWAAACSRSSSTTWVPTTTCWSRRPRPWPPTWACRPSSR